MTGVELIAAERKRQVEEEGWMPSQDDEYEYGELTNAALAYLSIDDFGEHNSMTTYWPFDPEWFKPTTEIRNLTKAGALIAAEIDRLQRKSGRTYLQDVLDELFLECEHGDTEHRQWLKDKFEDFRIRKENEGLCKTE